VGDVIVSEVHFRPLDPDGDRPLRADNFEYLEITNRADRAVDVSGWRIAGSVEFTFDAGTVLAPEDVLVVVPFRPTDEAKSNVFRFFLNADVSLPLHGPYSQPLDDQANHIRLERIETPPDAPGPAYFVLEDAVQFHDQPPWPALVEGAGQSLTRLQQGVPGSNPIAWTAAMPSPGVAEFVARVPGDADDDGVFDQRDRVRILALGKYLTDAAATWEQGDWNGDGIFDQRDLVQALQG
jgi:hypothetical protein